MTKICPVQKINIHLISSEREFAISVLSSVLRFAISLVNSSLVCANQLA